MGRRVRIRHVDSGVRAVLKSDGVKAMLESQAAAAAAAFSRSLSLIILMSVIPTRIPYAALSVFQHPDC